MFNYQTKVLKLKYVFFVIYIILLISTSKNKCNKRTYLILYN